VGSSLAYSLLVHPEVFDVLILDRRPNKVASHVMDLELIAGGRVAAAGWEDVAGADVLVICAATALTENTSRDVYLADNAAIVDALQLDGFAGRSMPQFVTETNWFGGDSDTLGAFAIVPLIAEDIGWSLGRCHYRPPCQDHDNAPQCQPQCVSSNRAQGANG